MTSLPKENTPLLYHNHANVDGATRTSGNDDIEGQQREKLRKYSINGHPKANASNGGYNDGDWGDVGCDQTDLFYPPHSLCRWSRNELKYAWTFAVFVTATMFVIWMVLHSSSVFDSDIHSLTHQRNSSSWAESKTPRRPKIVNSKPYKLVERQVGNSFFDHYRFYDGPDSVGSGGHQVYVSQEKAKQLSLYNVSSEMVVVHENQDAGRQPEEEQFESREYIIMKSSHTSTGKRASIRLEGKRRYNHGLFVLDLDHMPAGAGVWPAFWMTDEAHWPDNGEIDILESINNQTRAKTALHTGGQCRMYGQIPENSMTGYWDRATGIPDPSTNKTNFVTNIEADDCWNLAAHRWYNQGCVLVDNEQGSIGEPFNTRGGGVYVLEWDPSNGYIKSWTFSRQAVPQNLQDAIHSSGFSNGHLDNDATSTEASTNSVVVPPNPDQWGLPYAYFAIGQGTTCSANHFQKMRLVFNLAFCGEVAGNRFFKDCHDESQAFNVSNDPIESCNTYIESNPQALDEAYWKIRGVYTWQH